MVGQVGIAQAQLSREEIDEMRRRGEDEGWTFTVGENPATERSIEGLCGGQPYAGTEYRAESAPVTSDRDLPSYFDWRDWGACTEIKDQLSCNGCFAFAAMGVFESAILINDGDVVDLSEQWVLDCTGAGNCVGGGNYKTAWDYCICDGSSQDNCGDTGAVLEADCPYLGYDAPCGCPYPHPYCISGYVELGATPPVGDIKQAIFDHGPVAATMGVNSAFQAYTGGVFNACTSPGASHMIILVGWDDNQGQQGIWFLRNSWGPGWGENGYCRIEYECLDVGDDAAYLNYSDDSRGVWVDFSYSGSETGSFWHPFSTIGAGIDNVQIRGNVLIKAGSTNETPLITKALNLIARGGTAVVGQGELSASAKLNSLSMPRNRALSQE
jgi:hypothetical protein